MGFRIMAAIYIYVSVPAGKGKLKNRTWDTVYGAAGFEDGIASCCPWSK